jgi:hypothetical protein
MTLIMPTLSELTSTFLGVGLKIFKPKICQHVRVVGLVEISLAILFMLYKQLKFLLPHLDKLVLPFLRYYQDRRSERS